jgi:hypothetical protein
MSSLCRSSNLHPDGRNSMAKTHPELAIEYQGDSTKVIAGTGKKLDWKCSTCQHEWKAPGNNRVHGIVLDAPLVLEDLFTLMAVILWKILTLNLLRNIKVMLQKLLQELIKN